MAEDQSDRPLADILAEEPREFFFAVRILTDTEADSVEDFLELAERMAADEGVNLIRAMTEHPELVRSFWGIDPDFSEDLIARIDEHIEDR